MGLFVLAWLALGFLFRWNEKRHFVQGSLTNFGQLGKKPAQIMPKNRPRPGWRIPSRCL